MQIAANAKLGEALHRYIQGLWEQTEFKDEMSVLIQWKEKSPVFLC